MKNLTTLDEILDEKYGKRDAKKREKWEQNFEAFKSNILKNKRVKRKK